MPVAFTPGEPTGGPGFQRWDFIVVLTGAFASLPAECI